MKTLLLLIASLVAAPSTQPAAAPTTKPVAVNKICPVGKEPVDPDAKTYEYNGKVIGFCCNGCLADFKKDPEKYMKDLK